MRTRNAFVILTAFLVSFFLVQSEGARAQIVPAAPAPAAKRVELYGVFNKSAQGAVTFTAYHEPDVIYDPLTVSADPTDYIGILVKITGLVTDSFIRGDRVIKTLNLEKITPMDQEYGNTRVFTAPFYGTPGSDPVEIHIYEQHTCFLYDNYAVQQTISDYSEGMNLAVIPRSPSDDPAALCENMKAAPYMLIPNEGADHFYGLSGDRLFVDDGEGPPPHALVVYDLTTKKAAFTAPFFPPLELAKNRYLEFSALGGPEAVKKGRDKQAAARGGDKDKGARENIRVDLKNFAVERVGK